MPKEPFVSGVYRPEEDARNLPPPSIEQSTERVRRAARRRKFTTISMRSERQMENIRRATNRMIGERD